MSWAYLAVTLVGACFVLNAFHPVRIEPFSVPSFFALGHRTGSSYSCNRSGH